MRFFVKAVATGFAMSMGSALFKKLSKKMGLESEETKEGETGAAKACSDSEGESPEGAHS